MNQTLLIKIIIYCCFTVILTSCHSNGSRTEPIITTDSLKENNSFIEYTAAPCLSNLLVAIVGSNKQFYKTDEFFYSLTFQSNNGNRRMTIDARQWDAPGKQPYKGVIKIGNALFLCNGDFDRDSLFEVKGNSVIKTPLKVETLENVSYPIAEEPALNGNFMDCEDNPIHIEIYTKGKIVF